MPPSPRSDTKQTVDVDETSAVAALSEADSTALIDAAMSAIKEAQKHGMSDAQAAELTNGVAELTKQLSEFLLEQSTDWGMDWDDLLATSNAGFLQYAEKAQAFVRSKILETKADEVFKEADRLKEAAKVGGETEETEADEP